MAYELHFEAVLQPWRWIALGLGTTLYISIVSMTLALVLGFVVALCRLSSLAPCGCSPSTGLVNTPERAKTIQFTEPYVPYQLIAMIQKNGGITEVGQLDRP